MRLLCSDEKKRFQIIDQSILVDASSLQQRVNEPDNDNNNNNVVINLASGLGAERAQCHRSGVHLNLATLVHCCDLGLWHVSRHGLGARRVTCHGIFYVIVILFLLFQKTEANFTIVFQNRLGKPKTPPPTAMFPPSWSTPKSDGCAPLRSPLCLPLVSPSLAQAKSSPQFVRSFVPPPRTRTSQETKRKASRFASKSASSPLPSLPATGLELRLLGSVSLYIDNTLLLGLVSRCPSFSLGNTLL